MAKKKNGPGEGKPAKHARRDMIRHIQKGCCASCGRAKEALTFEHVKPRHKGGRMETDNLILTCLPCNAERGSREYLLTRKAEHYHKLVSGWSLANGHNSDVRHWTVRPQN